jgi:hypothetical protein
MSGEIYILDPSTYNILRIKEKTSDNKRDIILWIIKDHFQLLRDDDKLSPTIRDWADFYIEEDFDNDTSLQTYFETFKSYNNRDYVFFY